MVDPNTHTLHHLFFHSLPDCQLDKEAIEYYLLVYSTTRLNFKSPNKPGVVIQAPCNWFMTDIQISAPVTVRKSQLSCA